MASYDLWGLRDLPSARRTRRGRPVLLGLTVLFLLLAAVGLLSALETTGGSTLANVRYLFAGTGLLGAAGCAYAFSLNLPGAEDLEVSVERVSLRFANGKEFRRNWDDSELDLRMEHALETSKRPEIWVVYGPGLVTSFVPRDAYEEIRTTARSKGLRLSEGPGRYMRSTATRITAAR